LEPITEQQATHMLLFKIRLICWKTFAHYNNIRNVWLHIHAAYACYRAAVSKPYPCKV